MRKRRQAFVSWNAGICRVVDSATQTLVAKSIHFRRATRAARRRGYDVTVYKGEYAFQPTRPPKNGHDVPDDRRRSIEMSSLAIDVVEKNREENP
jgi:hypothetical protein